MRALARVPVPGLEPVRRVRVGHDVVHAGADLVHLGGVRDLVGRFERRPVAAAGGKLGSSFSRRPAVAVHRSATRSSSAASPGDDAQEVVAALARPAGAVGADVAAAVRAALPRTSTVDGVALEDVRCPASSASFGTTWTPVAPVPTDCPPACPRGRSGRRPGRPRCRRSPSARCGRCGPRSRSMPGMPGSFGSDRVPVARDDVGRPELVVRSVVTIHVPVASSQVSEVTAVENRASA